MSSNFNMSALNFSTSEITERQENDSLRGLKIECEKPYPIYDKDVMLDFGYRLDLLVEGQVTVAEGC